MSDTGGHEPGGAIATGSPRLDAALAALRLGLGAMPLSTHGRPERDAAIATVHAALDAGVRLVDTADAYCLDVTDTGHNEELVAEALGCWAGPRADVLVATKGGHVRGPRGEWWTDGRPVHLVDAARRSRDRLGVDRIGLYQFHRPDPGVRLEDSLAAVAGLVEAGVVDAVGLSNVDVDLLERARGIVDVASVQNELSPYRADPTDLDVVDWCHERGTPLLAWAPLGGAGRAAAIGDDTITRPFAAVARRHGASAAEIVIAWLLHLSPVIVPIPGARRPATIRSSVAATRIELGEADLAELDARLR